jgi:hypothetical protein
MPPRCADPDARHGVRQDLERLEHEVIGWNHHHALVLCLSMIFSENRFPLFRIML